MRWTLQNTKICHNMPSSEEYLFFKFLACECVVSPFGLVVAQWRGRRMILLLLSKYVLCTKLQVHLIIILYFVKILINLPALSRASPALLPASSAFSPALAAASLISSRVASALAFVSSTTSPALFRASAAASAVLSTAA